MKLSPAALELLETYARTWKAHVGAKQYKEADKIKLIGWRFLVSALTAEQPSLTESPHYKEGLKLYSGDVEAAKQYALELASLEAGTSNED